MKILVLSDSHSGISFMRYAYQKVRPDAVIHLGDYFDDGETLRDAFPGMRLMQVPGNCDRFRCVNLPSEVLTPMLGGVKLYLTHGHLHRVKSTSYLLLQSAREAHAAAALYGHTHEPDCHREPDGLWVLNPGACGSFGGSVGLMEIENGTITNCRILRQRDMEEM